MPVDEARLVKQIARGDRASGVYSARFMLAITTSNVLASSADGLNSTTSVSGNSSGVCPGRATYASPALMTE